MANFIDVFVFIAIVVLFLVVILPLFLPYGQEEISLGVAGISFILVGCLVFLLQYPFMRINQTIGKAFFGLRIESTNDRRPLTVGIIVQRELFAKALTCYFMCLPVFFGNEGQHDIVCETRVV